MYGSKIFLLLTRSLEEKPKTQVHDCKLDYCQYLLSSQINFTITNFADHTEKFSTNGYLIFGNWSVRQDKLS